VKHQTQIAWIEPLNLAHHFRHLPVMTLLYSGRKEAHTGRYSYLALGAAEVKSGKQFDELPKCSGVGELPEWFGYLGYGLRRDTEDYALLVPSPVTLPDFRMIRPKHMFRFDHDKKIIDIFGDETLPPLPASFPEILIPDAPRIQNITSNFSDEEYCASVAATLTRIEAGDFYQANLTRKFFGELTENYPAWDIFLRLAQQSPAPYSAFFRYHDEAIISSSPECFLNLEKNGKITARPIKGSAARSLDEAEDAQRKAALEASGKDHAENLMIVDLLRHDLARVALPGTVRVTEQSALYSYATIHHLVSTITAQKQPGLPAAAILKACFPPGSMTGAPKIAAVRWCDMLEKLERGVYSGAIGWLGAADTAEFSVVIRTLVMKGTHFEFQVGGGIVADSVPEEELRETETKSRAIRLALGLRI